MAAGLKGSGHFISINSDCRIGAATVRYEAVNAMLLNEFLKEHRKVQEQEQKLRKQEATIVRQQKYFESKFAQQQKQIETLTGGLQKVSAAVELNKRTPTQIADTR